MNDAVADVIAARESLDRGFSGGVLLSSLFHGALLGAALLSAWLGASAPQLKASDAYVVPLPPGGGGPTEVAAGVPAPVKSQPPDPAPEPIVEPQRSEPKIVKPPKVDESKHALPDPDSKKVAKKPTPAPPRQAAAPAPERPRPGPVGAGGTRTTSATPGIGIIGPAGPGVPGGIDPNGDWYLAGVQRKIWIVWTQQMKPGFARPVRVSFTIRADGSLADGSVQILDSSGAALIDNAAKRAVFSAANFSPLPKHYGTDQITIQALFEPIS